MTRTRKILFYFFLSLFIIATPILIAFSLGYTLNFHTAQVEQTGGIFVKSKTGRLSLFLDGVFQKETSLLSGGALLTELVPRTYLLRIEKEGYRSWSKTVPIDGSFVKEFRNVVLIQNPVVIATSSLAEVANLPSLATPPSFLTIDKKNNLIDTTSGKILAPNIHVFSTNDTSVYLIDKNGFLARLNRDTGAMDILGRPGFYLENKNFSFIFSPTNDLAIIDPSGGLFLLTNNDTLHVITGGVKKVSFDLEGKKLLIAKEKELCVYWITDNTFQPFQKSGTSELITQFDSPILDAAWYFDTNAHIIAETSKEVLFTEIDTRGGHNTISIIHGKVNKIMTSSQAPRTLFYQKGKTWFKVEF